VDADLDRWKANLALTGAQRSQQTRVNVPRHRQAAVALKGTDCAPCPGAHYAINPPAIVAAIGQRHLHIHFGGITTPGGIGAPIINLSRIIAVIVRISVATVPVIVRVTVAIAIKKWIVEWIEAEEMMVVVKIATMMKATAVRKTTTVAASEMTAAVTVLSQCRRAKRNTGSRRNSEQKRAINKHQY
jgi:hypothetical protein